MKKTALLTAVFLICSPLAASFYGVALFRARVTSIRTMGMNKAGKYYISFQTTRWLKGGGHFDTFGKRMVGKSGSFILKHIAAIKPGAIITVRYRTSSGFYSRDGKVRGYCHSRWKYIGAGNVKTKTSRLR